MTRPMKGIWNCLLSLLGLYGGAASAASVAVLCNGDIKGETQYEYARDCIDVLAWSWGLIVPQDAGVGGATGSPELQGFSISKYIDTSSEDLFRLAVTQLELTGDVEFRAYGACSIGCSTPTPFLTISMSGVRVSSQSMGGSSGGGKGTENVTLVFEEITYCYQNLVKGSTPQCFSYNPVQNI